VPGLLDAINASQTSNHNVKAVLVRLAEGRSAEMVGRDIHRWKHRQVFDREQMEEILVAKLIGTHNRTIAGMILPRKSSPLSGASTTSEMVGLLGSGGRAGAGVILQR
jgi:hypothetical protein